MAYALFDAASGWGVLTRWWIRLTHGMWWHAVSWHTMHNCVSWIGWSHVCHMTLLPYRASFMAKIIMVDGITYRFNIWDTSGQERVCLVSATYWNNICVCIHVCSLHACALFSAVSIIVANVLQRCCSRYCCLWYYQGCELHLVLCIHAVPSLGLQCMHVSVLVRVCIP